MNARFISSNSTTILVVLCCLLAVATAINQRWLIFLVDILLLLDVIAQTWANRKLEKEAEEKEDH